MSRVSVEIENHIARVTLTRADKMNAVDQEMAEAIVAAGEGLIGNADVRAVVLSAEGNGFCAGLDLSNFAKFAAGNPEDLVMPRSHGSSNLFQQVAMVWRKVPVPVIAALHGVAFGAGFQLALGADIRIAHPETKLAVMEMKWGLVPDMGGMALLPALTRSDVIRRMTYTADPVLAPQALEWGLITELSDDPLDAALTLAARIAGKSPSAMRAAKRLIEVAESGADEAVVLLEESREQAALIGKADQMEVIAANMQKRAPVFKG
ncbi:crotonase/enoyl-CoA hydratase family protein [Thalassovita taeanensis]|uniref:Enoyl-CoA hydratase/carnithine racemase n=1 Tax=Thalassovita taeanensis TaxID=657014 RepID=A0A1H9FEV0_9RHOB|nr:crotonase/enoyl-CoA hydratase family protein [Thalassovita taeanensis]SEQ36456.1 Enoyl-CoA hydratase/carnithine racemase [Thalassovita taeanensis]